MCVSGERRSWTSVGMRAADAAESQVPIFGRRGDAFEPLLIGVIIMLFDNIIILHVNV